MSAAPNAAGSLRAPLIVCSLLIVLAVAGVALGGKVIAQQIASGLMLGAIYLTVAVAFTLTIGVLNFLNFTIPTMFMLAGMLAWGLNSMGLFSAAGRWSWLVALAVGIATSVIASLVVERFTYRYQRTRHGDATEHAIPLVSSLGFLLIFEHLVLIAFGSEAQRFPVPFKADLNLFGIVIGLPQLMSLLLALAIVAVLTAVLKRTRMGRALRTIAENPDTASLLGVEVGRGRACGVRAERAARWSRRRPVHGQLRRGFAVHGRQCRLQGDRRDGARRAWIDLGRHCRRTPGRPRGNAVDPFLRG